MPSEPALPYTSFPAWCPSSAGSLVGIVYFHDLRGSPSALGLFSLGALVLCAGVLVLALQRAPPPDAATEAAIETVHAALTDTDGAREPALRLATAPGVNSEVGSAHGAGGLSEEADISESPKAQLLRSPAPLTSAVKGSRQGSAGLLDLDSVRAASAHASHGDISDDSNGTLAPVPWWEREALSEVSRLARLSLGLLLVARVRAPSRVPP